MDNSPRLTLAPDRRYTIAAAVGALVAAGAAAALDDPPGRLLLGLAALVLAVYAVGDLVYSPRLVVDAAGVRIRSPFSRADLAWHEIDAIRADTRTRYGLRATTLEIDAGAVLAVFSRRALGADPAEVALFAEAFRPPSPGQRARRHDENDDGEDGA